MRWRLLIVVALLAVGVGAVGFTVFGPTLARNGDGSDYLTATAAVADVTDQAVADGAIAAATIYGLSFGADPRVVDGSEAGGGSDPRLVKGVNVRVGQAVAAGEVLAEADTTDAQQALELAQANLDAAQARYDADRAGTSATDQESAQLSIDQAQAQLDSARQSRDDTARENRIRLDQADGDVDRASSQLDDDRDADAPDSVIDADKDALRQARESLALLRVQVETQNRQAREQVESAQLALDSARNSYDSHTEPVSAETLASDRASLLQVQAQLDDAQADIDAATLRSPIAGIVIAVNLVVGTTTPSGDAVQVMAPDKEIVAEFAESDLPDLAVGQPATVTVSATDDVLTGTVAAISPVASTSSGSSVVSYSVTVALSDVPAGVLPGMSADVAITTAQALNVLAVPATALGGAGGNYTVQVLDGTGQVSVRQVEVGLVTSSLAEIKSGLAQGEQVVVGTTSALNASNGGFIFPGGGGGARQLPPDGGQVQVQTGP